MVNWANLGGGTELAWLRFDAVLDEVLALLDKSRKLRKVGSEISSFGAPIGAEFPDHLIGRKHHPLARRLESRAAQWAYLSNRPKIFSEGSKNPL